MLKIRYIGISQILIWLLTFLQKNILRSIFFCKIIVIFILILPLFRKFFFEIRNHFIKKTQKLIYRL